MLEKPEYKLGPDEHALEMHSVKFCNSGHYRPTSWEDYFRNMRFGVFTILLPVFFLENSILSNKINIRVVEITFYP
jgi:hypothetical protein